MIVLVVFLTIVLSPLALYTREREHRLASAAGHGPFIYTVKKGDTLYDIAGEYRIELSELMKANNLTGSLILPGDTLILPLTKIPPVSLSCGGGIPG